MLKRLLSLFNRTPPVVVSTDLLLSQFKALEPGSIKRKYRYAEHGLSRIEMRTESAAELYEHLARVRAQIKSTRTIKPFELGPLKEIYLDDYLIVEDGLAVDLRLYFQSLKEVATELLTLLQETAGTQEADYYRVRTQLLMDDLKTLIDAVLKL